MRFKLHPTAVLAISSLSTPPLGLVFILYSLSIGNLLLEGTLSPGNAAIQSDTSVWDAVKTYTTEIVIGGIVGGTALGCITYFITLGLTKLIPANTREIAAETTSTELMEMATVASDEILVAEEQEAQDAESEPVH